MPGAPAPTLIRADCVPRSGKRDHYGANLDCVSHFVASDIPRGRREPFFELQRQQAGTMLEISSGPPRIRGIW